jgi:pyruvate/2-oxoglutarate dehydrogenase complex dihydrolipoamide acyltransferase (E2) component
VSELAVLAPFAGTVVAIARDPDDQVGAGEALVVLEAMKMEHEILAEVDGVVRTLDVAVGDTVEEGQRLALLDPDETRQHRASHRTAPPPTTPPPTTPPPTTPPPTTTTPTTTTPTTRHATTSRRYARATTRRSTPPGPTRSPDGTSRAAGPRARTSTTSSIRGASWSTDR